MSHSNAAGKLERLKNVEWKEPLGKGLRVTSQIVGVVSDFVPFAGIVKGATSMVADMLDPPVTLDQIRDCSFSHKNVFLKSKNSSLPKALPTGCSYPPVNFQLCIQKMLILEMNNSF